MKIKIVILIGLLMMLISPIYAQRRFQKMDSDKQQNEEDLKRNETQPWTEKIKYGGAVSGGFGTYYSFFFLQPFIAYKIDERFLPGVGFTYIYSSQTYAFNTSPISDNAFGPNIFCKAQVVGPLALYAEYSPVNFTSYNSYGEHKRIWGQQFFVGGGLHQQHSYLMLVYDLLWQNVSSPSDFYPFRPSPVDIRVGFVF